MKLPRANPLMFWIIGAAFLGFDAWTIAERARLEVAGTIVSSDTECPDPARPNYRCITTYKILADGAQEPVEYWTAGNDPSLQQRLPVGTKLVKKKGAISYTVNGKLVNDFPLTIYVLGCLFGAFCLVFGTIGAVRELRLWWAETANEPGART